MGEADIIPPENLRKDPPRGDVDPIALALERLQILLIWIDEHLSAFIQLRQCDPSAAESELNHLKSASEQAVLCLNLLTQLMMRGDAIDLNKPLPTDLCSNVWFRLVDIIKRGKEVEKNKLKEKDAP
jgi:hypothetical protein